MSEEMSEEMSEMSEEEETLDIVALVQNNPLIKLTSDYDYNSKIIEKIKSVFTNYEQQLFVANFYCYLNYDSRKDFVVDLDFIWKWIGFGKKSDCKNLLVNNFQEAVDYKINKSSVNSDDKVFAAAYAASKLKPKKEQEKTETRGGSNKEQILLTIHCFKKLCLKAKTKKSDQIHEYYVNLEELMNELVSEQAKELCLKLKNSKKQLENTFIDCYDDKDILYLISVEEKVDEDDDEVDKFGVCNRRFKKRLNEHKRIFGPKIFPRKIFEIVYNRLLESAIKNDPIIKPHIISKKYNNTVQTELIRYDKNFTFEDLVKRIEELQEEILKDGYLLKENEKLKLEIEQLKLQSANEIIQESNKEIGKLKTKNVVLTKQIKEEPFKAYNLSTKEIISFKSFSDGNKISGIGPHSIRDNYLDKPKQHNGFVYYSDNKPHWKPPTNFKFDTNVKPSIHMVMCKSIHKETKEVTYYNSITEAGKIIGLDEDDSTMRKFSWLCAENANGKASTHEILNKFTWYKVNTCGSWIYPDGKEEPIKEELIIKKSDQDGKSKEMLISIDQLGEIFDNNQKIKQRRARKKTTEIFIEQAIQKHGNKFDYSKVDYKHGREKVIIICKIHGEFEQTPEKHLKNGCQKC